MNERRATRQKSGGGEHLSSATQRTKEFGAFKDGGLSDPSQMPYETYHRKLYSRLLFYRMILKDIAMVNELRPLFDIKKIDDSKASAGFTGGLKWSAKPFNSLTAEQQELVKILLSEVAGQPRHQTTGSQPPQNQTVIELGKKIEQLSVKLNNMSRESERNQEEIVNLKRQIVDLAETIKTSEAAAPENIEKLLSTLQHNIIGINREIEFLKGEIIRLQTKKSASNFVVVESPQPKKTVGAPVRNLYGVPLNSPATIKAAKEVLIDRLTELKQVRGDLTHEALREILASEFPHNSEIVRGKMFVRDLLSLYVYVKHPELQKRPDISQFNRKRYFELGVSDN